MQQTADYVRVRWLHTSPDTPSVAIFVDGAPVVQQLAYGQVSEAIQLSADRHQVSVFPVGTNAPQDVLISTKLQKLRPEDFTLSLTGVRKDLQIAMLPDSVPPPGAGQAKVRVFHASPDAPALDAGTSADPRLFTLVSYTEVTPFKDVEARTVDVRLRRSGSTDTLVTLNDYVLTADREYTFVALGLLDGQPRLTLLPLVRDVVRCPA